MQLQAIDTVVKESNSLFKQFLLAHTALSIGQGTLTDFPDAICISTTVGLDIEIEPIPMGELKRYRDELPKFLLEIFHGKLVQIWNECLSNLFQMLVDLHFSGQRQFIELKKRNISLDFQEDAKLEIQVKDRLCHDFGFQNYSDRVKLLNAVFNPNQEQCDYLYNVSKNVQVRNAFQHRERKVDEFLLRELGVQKISLLDDDGKPQEYLLGDILKLSVPEFDAFRRSLLMVGQLWRKWNG